MTDPLTGHFYEGQSVTEASERAQKYLPHAPKAPSPWEAIADNRNDSIATLNGLHHALVSYDSEVSKLKNANAATVEEKKSQTQVYNNMKFYTTLVGAVALAITTGFLLRAIWPFRAAPTES